jgi:hypothetical protein
MSDILKERAGKVEDAFRLLQGNKDSLGNIPGILRQLVSLRVWEGYDWRGKTVTFGTFREFVESPAPEGLGSTVPELMSLCRKYPEIADLIDSVVQEQSPSYRPPKSAHKGNHKRPSGTSFQRNLRRLRNLALEDKEAKRLHAEVLAGRMTANGALRALGKRKARYGVEATPESVQAFVKKHLNSRQIKRLVDLLQVK